MDESSEAHQFDAQSVGAPASAYGHQTGSEHERHFDEDDATVPDSALGTNPEGLGPVSIAIPDNFHYGDPLLYRSPYKADSGHEWARLSEHGQYRLSNLIKSPELRNLYNQASDRAIRDSISCEKCDKNGSSF